MKSDYIVLKFNEIPSSKTKIWKCTSSTIMSFESGTEKVEQKKWFEETVRKQYR